MHIPEITQILLAAKEEKGLSFEDLAKLVKRNEVWVASVIYRQASASLEEAKILVDALEVPPLYASELTKYPIKGSDSIVPTDPFIYRFYEIMQVYGLPLKDIVQEKFGDGIMSAIDFTLNVDKEEDPKGDRVRIIMSGKFLPYQKW
ncbi:cyanate hydratase [Rivularia sp. IAM M-261]|nr:cyanate hydratase [Calothrix sp. PCC 7716]GJD18671.1 cyanate hydratase [Rivularia sp. IAM M-261]